MALGVAGAWAGGASTAGEGKVRAGKGREPEPREEAYAAEGVRPPRNSRNPLPKLPPEFSPELSGEADPQAVQLVTASMQSARPLREGEERADHWVPRNGGTRAREKAKARRAFDWQVGLAR
jgi:hypothetical protein